MEFKDLIKKILRYNKESDIGLLEKSYKYSENFLINEFRNSKKPMIIHCLEVADEVIKLKLDDISIAAALLHPLIKKGADQKKLEQNFGREIVELIISMNKISEIKKNISGKVTESENLRKVLLAASKDIRALLIKLCDKLVNLRDAYYLPDSKVNIIAKESMEIYAPLAYRLGCSKIKSELEDLAFKYLEKEKYKYIEEKVNKIRKEGEKYIFKLKTKLEKELEKEEIKSEVQARVKHIHSIYKKTILRDYTLENMSDIIGIRIIVENIDDCYKALRIIHSNFRPIQSKFKDYIALPKPNGYQSLHTAVVDSEGHIFEVQIRTLEMHEISEEGIAAHFTYKGMKKEEIFDKKLGWLKELVNTKANNISLEFFSDQIFVFTPNGKMIELPSGSTPLDFAYHIHTDLGNKCTGAKVNGKLVQLKTVLENGDIIEIIESKNQKPSREWMKFVKTSRARDGIKHSLKEKGEIPASSYSVNKGEKLDVGEGLIYIENFKDQKIRFAMCCNTLPGENIAAVSSGKNKLTIHKINCTNIIKNKIIKCTWKNMENKTIDLSVNAEDRPGLFAEILNSISSLGINIENTKGKSMGNKMAKCSFKVKVKNIEHLNEIISRIKKIRSVKNVYLAEI